MALKRLKSFTTIKVEGEGKRCEARHPNHHWVRCQLPTYLEDHYFHWGNEGEFRWSDK